MNFLRCAALAALVFNFAFTGLGKDNTNGLWFGGPEIFPINQGISDLHAADLNGNGLNDLVVADNPRSKIVLLYNRTGKTNQIASPTFEQVSDINQLPPGSRFHIDSIPVDERISAMVVTDLNGDGRPDIAFYGDGKNLEVIYNRGTNGWSDPKTWNINDGQMNQNALATGDLNGDGRTDLVLLGDNGSLYYFEQKKDHTLADPVKIPYSGSPSAAQIVDVDGDGRKDLLLVDWDSPTPFRVRFQDAAGRLGPEVYFKTQPIRSYCADNLTGNDKTYVATIAQNSGRAAVSQFIQDPAGHLSGTLERGQFQVLPLNKTSAAQRGILWTDVNGDGRPDLLVAQPDSGQISVYLQRPDGSLGAPETFPTLAGVSQIAAADWNGDGKPDIFLLSQSEGAVGVASFDKDGRLPFPTLLPIDGKPLVMAVGPLRHGSKPVLCLIVDKNGQRYLVTRTFDGKTRTQKLSAGFTDMPTTMEIQDVNQDGLPDLVILIPYDKIKVLLQKPDGSFDEEDVDPPGGVMAQPWLASMDVDGDGKPELLLPGKNFVRAVVLKKETEALAPTNQPQWVFQVKDQINGVSSDSQIMGACTVSTGAGQPPSVFLLDAEHQELTLCQRDKLGVWRVTRNIPLPVGGFSGLQTVALGGPGVRSIVFSGQDAVAWMPLAGRIWKLKELDGYDTPIKNGYLNDVTTGDFTGDGRKDLVFLETSRHYLDIVRFSRKHKLVPVVRWKVFEEHTFQNTMNTLPEPREALVANVTGHKNKKKDLVVLVHDRILVYPQK